MAKFGHLLQMGQTIAGGDWAHCNFNRCHIAGGTFEACYFDNCTLDADLEPEVKRSILGDQQLAGDK